ncbi:endopeptidase La [Taibaiella sp. KBW10]|uniref:endopeptidase La n=1 Tax=Taibaiella sp. KBW10 TaxID=2153357 RepID=UPI000F5A0691|nr:endopeptidase La [Taibaiella sp. KBW10]RQO30675.1 endopeptidase La [Taibaiella sp. KBW10]
MNFKDLIQNSNTNDLEFLPIVPLGEMEIQEEDKKKLPKELPIIALRNTVLFPNVVLPITVARDKSLQAIEAVQKGDGFIGVLAQQDSNNENPTTEEIYSVGTVAKIIKQIKLPDGNTTLFIMGRMRFEIKKYTQDSPYLKAEVKYLEDKFPKVDKEYDAMISSMKDIAERIVQLSPNIQIETGMMLKNIESHSFLIHFIATNLDTKLIEKQRLLEINDIRERTANLFTLLQADLQMAELKNEITNKARGEMDKQQREYFLQQQLKSIKDELNDGNEKELSDLRKRGEAKLWNEKTAEAFYKDIEKLERMHPSTPDYSVVYNHAELMLELPWNEFTTDKYDLKKVMQVMDGDHFGMEKIKERILEYLAVLKLKGDMKSPILCFVGPPGIGKTSLAHSIAKAINRTFVRLSLGGVSDESELRGHRKTYIGAMPGRIIQSLKKAKSSNPVFILDEIDKLGKDFKGDPSSAMLEILDPEQNHSFYDNYLELEYDLSKVLFIATANNLGAIPPALRDRLEVINLSGYAIEEKIEIAKKHLIPKQKEAHGLANLKLNFSNNVLQQIIESYTRESGVRELDRKIAGVMRHVAMDVATNKKVNPAISAAFIQDSLGKPVYMNDEYASVNIPGIVMGLAWTYVGGDILFIETILSKGKGGLTLTGNLGNVMKESATTALSYLKAHGATYNIPVERFEETNVHIHVPEGAQPKDGPSAGITMLTSLASAFTGRKVRSRLAMTGEITLRGQVLPVGGIKEKVLAAKRSGAKEIILCAQNRSDIEEITPSFIKGLKFHYVTEMKEVLELALLKR